MASEPQRTIVLIEDDEGFATLFEYALSECGVGDCRVVRVEDGAAGLALLRENGATPADLVFLDLNLPRCSGIEVLQALRDSATHTSTIVVLSSSGDPSDRKQCHDLGAVDFIVKPLDYDELVRTIGAALQRHLPAKDT